MKVTSSQNNTDDMRILSEKFSVGGKDWFRVTQFWPYGSKWWSQYIKEDFDSQIGMRATMMGEPKISWTSLNDDIQLGIGILDASSVGGRPINLRIALRNNSDHNISSEPLLSKSNLKVSVVDEQNRQVELSEFGKLQKGSLDFSTSIKPIPAHSILYVDDNIGNFYDMTLAGNYLVTVALQDASKRIPGGASLSLPLNVKI